MKRIVLLKILIMASFLILVFPRTFLAYATFNHHRLISGVGNYGKSKQFYFVQSVAKGDQGRIDRAMNKWVNSNGTGMYTPISFRRTTNQKASTIDWDKSNVSNRDVLATTRWYVRKKDVNPARQNWYWTKITIYQKYHSMTSRVKDITCAHEAGHAFGLAHVNNRNFLMYPNAAQTRPTGPTRDEFYGINYLY